MLSTIQQKASNAIDGMNVGTATAGSRFETNRSRENRRYGVAFAVSVFAFVAVVILGISVL